MADNKAEEVSSEQASLIAANLPNPLDWIGGWKGKAVKEVANMINDELNEKRLIFNITIKNHYHILNKQMETDLNGWKFCCWKYMFCGLWSCMNCCCKKRCLCSFCCMISNDKKITQDIGNKLSNQLSADDVKHKLNVLNDTDIEIILLHLTESWLEKAKEMAIEHIAPVIIQQQINEILKQYGAEVTITSERKIVEVDENIINDQPKNDGKYL